MSTITIELTDEQISRLRNMAVEAGSTPEALARAGVEWVLSDRATDFKRVAEYVVRKNKELYERLAR
jgi:hypothetical protein